MAISRALMNNLAIIFGDEPTGTLNSKSAFEVMEILREIAARTERILYMLDGNLIGEKTAWKV